MTTIFQAIPMINTPRKFYASLRSAKLTLIVCLTTALIVILNAKIRCFSVLAAALENQTCNTINDTCGMATLNWIAFLGQTIIVGGNPFITNMFIRVHKGALGGRITFQFCLILTLGILLTSFVSDPESLFVTDTIMQGVATSVILGLASFKMTHIFPEESSHYRTALLLSEITPWFGVFLCPLYGTLINIYGWQSSYLLTALLIMIICLLAGIIEPKITAMDSNDEDDDLTLNNENIEYYKYNDYWEIEEFEGIDCRHPNIMQLLLNTNVTEIISRGVVITWFVERALLIIAEFNLIINIVHYMTSILLEPILHGSMIMITLGSGNIMGYIAIYAMGTDIRKYLIKIHLIASVFLVISYIVWQVYGSKSNPAVFTVPDAHFMTIVIGVFSGITSSQTYYVAEDVMERPRIISMSLTKLAESLGLLIGPITSGMLIQINYFHSFFSVQACIHSLRIILLAFIIYKKYND